jgi:hypothetical protein
MKCKTLILKLKARKQLVRRRREDNIKTGVRNLYLDVWTVFNSLNIESVSGILWILLLYYSYYILIELKISKLFKLSDFQSNCHGVTVTIFVSVCLSRDLQPFVGPWPLFSFLTLYTVGRTPWTWDQLVARPLPIHRITQTQNKRT